MTRKSLKFVATYIKVKTCISSQCRYLCGTSTSYAHGSTARPANAPKRKWLSLYILGGLRKSATWRCFCIRSCHWWRLRFMLEKGRECLDYDAHAGSKLRFVLHTECRHRCKLGNSLWRILSLQSWIYTLFHCILSQSRCCLHKIDKIYNKVVINLDAP